MSSNQEFKVCVAICKLKELGGMDIDAGFDSGREIDTNDNVITNRVLVAINAHCTNFISTRWSGYGTPVDLLSIGTRDFGSQGAVSQPGMPCKTF